VTLRAKTHVARVCFKYFRCFIWMLQVLSTILQK
jgi:hypothetical protein